MRFGFPTTASGENVLTLFIYTCLVFMLVFFTSTIFSGFHLYDDQILIGFHSASEHQSFLSAASLEIKNDLYLRFRPMAILYYMALAKWLYPNFFLIAFVVALQGIFSCYFLYRFARSLKGSFWVSFLFPMFILCGNQGVIFWRNCVNETFGMLLLSLSLFFLGRLLNSKLPSNVNLFFFSFFLVLATLTKESFIILVPAIIFFKIWQESLLLDKRFSASLRSNIKLAAFFAMVVIAEIFTIYFYKNKSDHFIEYVAIDEDTFKVSNLLTSVYRITITKGYLLVVLPAIIFICLKSRQVKSWNQDVKKFFIPLLITFLLIIIPQVILYAKSLIFERYLLPATLSSGIVILLLHNYIRQHRMQLPLLNKTFLPASAVLLTVQLFLMVRAAPLYAQYGFHTKQMLDTIIQNTGAADTILLVASPLREATPALSTKNYLNAPIGGSRKNIFIEPVTGSVENLSPIAKADIRSFEIDTKGIRYEDIKDKKNITCYTFFENTLQGFTSQHPEFDTANYVKLNTGACLIFLRKK